MSSQNNEIPQEQQQVEINLNEIKSSGRPSYVIKAQKDYYNRKKDNEDFKQKRKDYAKQYYLKNKQRLNEKSKETYKKLKEQASRNVSSDN